MGRLATRPSTMKILFGFMILTVLMLICMEPNQVEVQVEPPYPPDYEVRAHHEIATELGKKDWNYNENPCNNKSSWFTPPPPPNVPEAINNSTVTCNCSFPNGECHIDGIYLLGQDLDGVLPCSLVKLSHIKVLVLYLNYLNGTIPREWAALKLETLTLSANYLIGKFPSFLANLSNIKELRISSNNFSGKMPDIFQSWKHLEKLEIQASGFEGPIPSSLALLHNLVELDLSFNNLEGNISDTESLTKMQYIQIDLSYNNFTESSDSPSCPENLNLFKSFSGGKTLGLDNCLKNFPCSKDWYSVNINCAGGATTINGIDYEGDEDLGGPAKYFPLRETWETSSTGLFWDTDVTSRDFIAQNVSILRIKNSELYTRARLSPLSLTYYFRCLANGNYTVTLHFAEIVIRDNRSYQSLGRRIFDVYVQEKLELKDFNIQNEAKGVDKAVSNKNLTIRFHWAGKGTTATPRRGTYGPLISAISVDSVLLQEMKFENDCLYLFFPFVGRSQASSSQFMGKEFEVCSGSCCFCSVPDFGNLRHSMAERLFSTQAIKGTRQMQAATNNFDAANKIGEGGFGAVYKEYALCDEIYH
ncbi:hypothetical protein GOBAR_AA20121 [Gossypium barbadense]|uniref:non-specific serine/threonine protein kinase n=1 Tax=Gossypium barbadense TaxID=3634 RepID=A0A2P5XB38_GOSBA|nr:hypothetical protein GOBAR_AA20121 [Gossypium barbadense]